MIACSTKKGDHPLRHRKPESTIVHAVRRVGSQYITACDHRTHTNVSPFSMLSRWVECKSTAKITCKNCQRALGFDKKPTTNHRYVIYDVGADMYFVRDAENPSWSDNILEATRYRTLEGAKDGRAKIVSHRYTSTIEGRFSLREFNEFKQRKDIKNLQIRKVRLDIRLVLPSFGEEEWPI